MSFGSRLKVVRKKFNLTQKDFATKLKITKASVINYEKGNRFPDSRLLSLIHKTYNIDINWILTGRGEMFFKSISKSKSEKLLNKEEQTEKINKLSKQINKLKAENKKLKDKIIKLVDKVVKD